MKQIELDTFEVSLLYSLLRKHIYNIEHGLITYGSEEEDREYREDCEKILNKLRK